MDFEPWIRAQLDTQREVPDPAPPTTPKRVRLRPPAPALQLVGAAAALTVIALGLVSGGPLRALQLSVLAPAQHELPVTTWAGSPAAPAGDQPAVPDAEPTQEPAAVAQSGSSPSPGRRPGTASGAGPSGAVRPKPSAQPATSPAANTSKTFTLQGGTARVSCHGGQISLDSASANSGYQLQEDWKDGGATLEVRFRSDAHESQLEAWCTDGQVQGQIEET